MNRRGIARILSSVSMVGLIWLVATGAAPGQFTQNRDKIKIDPSGSPPDIQKDYRLFRDKCGSCHGLDLSLRPSMSPAQWTGVVKRMQAMPSSHTNDEQAKAILDFLNYDEAHRKSQNKPAASAPPSNPVAAGRQFYYAQSCDACHTLGGAGGTGGGSLDDVGSRLTRAQITKRMQDRRAGAMMPPLPSDFTDKQIDDLVDFLLTLKGKARQ